MNFVKVNDINKIYYINNVETYNIVCKYLSNKGFVWLHDGVYYYREPIKFPFLIFASNKPNTIACTKIHEAYLTMSFYKQLLRNEKIKRVLK